MITKEEHIIKIDKYDLLSILRNEYSNDYDLIAIHEDDFEDLLKECEVTSN